MTFACVRDSDTHARMKPDCGSLYGHPNKQVHPARNSYICHICHQAVQIFDSNRQSDTLTILYSVSVCVCVGMGLAWVVWWWRWRETIDGKLGVTAGSWSMTHTLHLVDHLCGKTSPQPPPPPHSLPQFAAGWQVHSFQASQPPSTLHSPSSISPRCNYHVHRTGVPGQHTWLESRQKERITTRLQARTHPVYFTE